VNIRTGGVTPPLLGNHSELAGQSSFARTCDAASERWDAAWKVGSLHEVLAAT